MHETMADQGSRLAEEIKDERSKALPGRWECGRDLRARVVEYARACRAEGESHQRIADRLGLCQPTLSRWIRAATGAASPFRSVAIVPSHRHEEGAARAPAALRLVTPNGFVVEGLDPALFVSLLQVVG